MWKLLVISVIVCLLLVSCAGQEAIPTSSPSTLAEPTLAATSTPTLSLPTKQPPIPTLAAISTPVLIPKTKQPPIPTFTRLPAYPNKKVVFNYYTAGQFSLFDGFFGPCCRTHSSLVLYQDGLMISVGHPYAQKVLTPNQVKRFFDKLQELGFYSLESNQRHDPTDKLYNFGNNYQKTFDGPVDCIYANDGEERTLCAYEPDMEFLIPQMKSILHYLDEYSPSGMTPYYPDRILLLVEQGRDPDDQSLPKSSIPWPEGLPELAISPSDNFSIGWGGNQHLYDRWLYVGGPAAKTIYLLLGGSCCSGKVVTQNGQEYTIYIDVVLPHEKLTNALQ